MKKLIMIAAVIAIACATVTAQSERQKAKILVEIEQVINAQVAAWNNGDIDGFMEGYWKSDDMTFVSGNSVSKGWQAALDRYKRSYDTREKMGELLFSDTVVTVLNKNNAFVLGRFTLKRIADEPTGLFTLVFRRTKEGWKIIHDHTST